ncbi:MAG: phosphodiesterase [Burkholderiales bacterium]|nr:phosphodiesterase [Burkholderiales bacterium]
MLIAQVSDTHITSPGTLLAGRVDSRAQLARVVKRIEALDTRPDCLLLTGDLADRGTPEAYAALRRVLAPLAMPIYAIPGNHDLREPLRQAFLDCDWMPRAPGSRICYRVDLGALVLIALDSLIEAEDPGCLGAAQLDWLRARLDESSPRPVIVMVHHPPVDSGIAAMDAIRLQDADALGALIERHRNVERIVCGHLHRSMHLRWRGTVVSVPSSSTEQLQLAFDPAAPLGTIQEPAGFQLHYFSPSHGIITHAVLVGDYPGPFFSPLERLIRP